MLVSAGIPINIPAVFPGANAANVAMSVYDATGTSPVLLLSPVAMQHVAGAVYSGKFIPAAGKLYAIFLAVYTDASFTTLDGAFEIYQQSYGVQAEYLFTSGDTEGQIDGDKACSSPFSIFLSNAKTMNLKALQSSCSGGDPLDLTYCTEIDVALPKQDGTFQHFLLSTGDVTLVQPPVLGKFEVPISAIQSALLNVGVLQNFDVTFTILGQVFTVRYFMGLSVFEIR